MKKKKKNKRKKKNAKINKSEKQIPLQNQFDDHYETGINAYWLLLGTREGWKIIKCLCI